MSKYPTVKLGDVCIIERGGSPRPINKFITKDPNGINWIKIGDTSADSMYITKTAEKIIPEGVLKSRQVKKGDFILSNSMSFGRPYILNIDGCIHDGWLLIRDINDIFEKQFLYYYLSSETVYANLKQMAVGGVVNNLNSNKVRSLMVPVLKKEDQIKICNKLNKITTVIQQRKQQLAKLDELAKSRFLEMFGDPVLNEKNWDLKKWKDVLTIKNGKSQKNVLDANGKYPIYGSGGLMGRASAYITKANSIIIGRKGTIDKPFIVKEDFWNVDTAFGIEPDNNKISPHYLFFFCLFFDLKRLNKAAVLPSLVKSDLLNISMPIPPISIQNKFTLFIKQLDKSKFRIKKSLEKLELTYKALLQEYFG